MTRTPSQTIASQCLAVRMRKLSRVVSRLYDEELRPLGLKTSQLNVIVAVDAAGPMSPGALGHALALEKSTLSRNVQRMVARGWLAVEPRPKGPGTQLVCTPSGRALLERALPAWERAQARAHELLGEDVAASLPAKSIR